MPFTPTDFSEDCDRLARCQERALPYFTDLTKPQTAEYNARMAVASVYRGAPRWEREQIAAKQAFDLTTAYAASVYRQAVADLMLDGEISEATSYAFDEALLCQSMADEPAPRVLQAAE